MIGTPPNIYWKLVSIPFLLVGVSAAIVSAALIVKTVVFQFNTVSTTGLIERIEMRAWRTVQYAPIYSFRDNSGKTRQNEGLLCGKDRWRIGQVVGVRFDPRNPDESKLDCFHDIWMLPGLLGAFSGLYFFVIWNVFRGGSGSRWLRRINLVRSEKRI